MIPALGSMMHAEQATQEAAQHHKLVDAAQQFEAMFLNEMLKSAHFGGSDDADRDQADGNNGTLASMGTEALSKAIAAAGGMGVARHVVAEVEQEHARQQGRQAEQPSLKSLPAQPIKSL